MDNIENIEELKTKLKELETTIKAYENILELNAREQKQLYSQLEAYEKLFEMSQVEMKEIIKKQEEELDIEKVKKEAEEKRIKRITGLKDITLSTDNLVKKFGNVTAVDHVSLELRRGEIVGLLGPNGAGKTTTFYMIVGLEKPTIGKIFFGDLDITSMPMYKRARLGINYLPQEPSVFRGMTVKENIMSILEVRAIGKEERKRKLEELLNRLDIEYIANTPAYALSGGERRRVEIARALASEPIFLLLDEPFAGIDPIAVQEIQAIIRNLVDEMGVGILITDHNAREALRVTDRAYIIVEGSIFASGHSIELAHSPKVKKIYLGDNFKL